jgi:hypothetical protein
MKVGCALLVDHTDGPCRYATAGKQFALWPHGVVLDVSVDQTPKGHSRVVREGRVDDAFERGLCAKLA